MEGAPWEWAHTFQSRYRMAFWLPNPPGDRPKGGWLGTEGATERAVAAASHGKFLGGLSQLVCPRGGHKSIGKEVESPACALAQPPGPSCTSMNAHSSSSPHRLAPSSTAGSHCNCHCTPPHLQQHLAQSWSTTTCWVDGKYPSVQQPTNLPHSASQLERREETFGQNKCTFRIWALSQAP